MSNIVRSPTNFTIADRAWLALRDLEDAGAAISPHESAAGRSILYEVSPGGDRARCRKIIAEAKSDSALWHEVVGKVHLRSCGDAA